MQYGHEKKKAEILEIIGKADQAINEGGSGLQIIEAVSTSFYVLHLFWTTWLFVKCGLCNILREFLNNNILYIFYSIRFIL